MNVLYKKSAEVAAQKGVFLEVSYILLPVKVVQLTDGSLHVKSCLLLY